MYFDYSNVLRDSEFVFGPNVPAETQAFYRRIAEIPRWLPIPIISIWTVGETSRMPTTSALHSDGHRLRLTEVGRLR